MLSRRTVIAGVAVGAAALLAVAAWRARQDPTPAAAAAPAAAPAELVAMARLEPAGALVSVGAPSDDVIEAVQVQEGDVVAAGQPLARLSSHALRQAEVAASQAKLDRLALRDYDADMQRAGIRGLEAEAANAHETAQRQQRLFAERLASEQDVTAATLRARRADEALTQARIQLERHGAERGLARTEAERELAVAQRRLEQTIVRAPIAGRVLKLLVRPGERATAQGIAQIGDTASMVAVAEVHANDVRAIRPGQPARFTSPALSAPIEGRVDRVGQLLFRNDIFGDDPTAPTGLRVFEVRILLSDSTAAARFTHLEGQVRITLDRPDDR